MGRIIHVENDQIRIDWTCQCGNNETSFQQLRSGETLEDGTVVTTYCSECTIEHQSTWSGGELMIPGRYILPNRTEAIHGRFSLEQIRSFLENHHTGHLETGGYVIDGTTYFGIAPTLSMGDGAGIPEYRDGTLTQKAYFRRMYLGEPHHSAGAPDDLVEVEAIINVDEELYVSISPLPQYRMKPVWATIDDKGEFPYVDIFTVESEAMQQIGSKDGELTIVDFKPGACIVDRTGQVVDGTKEIYFSKDEIREVMMNLHSA